MRRIMLLALSLTLTTSIQAMAADIDADVQKALDAATAANKKAASVGYAWRDTKKIMKKAVAAAEKGDKAKAMALANEAHTQAKLAYAQYLEQRAAGPAF